MKAKDFKDTVKILRCPKCSGDIFVEITYYDKDGTIMAATSPKCYRLLGDDCCLNENDVCEYRNRFYIKKEISGCEKMENERLNVNSVRSANVSRSSYVGPAFNGH